MPMISTLPMSRRALIGAAAALPFAARAQAAWKPSRPVTLIVPFAAGSGTDSVSRLLATLLEQEWGSQVVVDNRPGANGAIAAVATARAAPDGHTVMITTNSPHGATPALMKRPTYDAINDFSPIGRMGTYIFVLAVNDQVPVRNLQEFLALARSQPGKLTYASGNTTGVVGGAMLTSLGNIQMEHVPYRSTPPAMTDVISGRVTGIIVDVAASRGFCRKASCARLASPRPRVPRFCRMNRRSRKPACRALNCCPGWVPLARRACRQRLSPPGMRRCARYGKGQKPLIGWRVLGLSA